MNDKPKIMQHCVEAYLNIGGPATEYLLLMNSPLKDKFQFDPLLQREAPHGINLALLRDMIAQIKKVKPDIVHVRGLHSEGFYGLLAARLAGVKKVVLCVHGTYTDSLNVGVFKKFIYGRIIEPFTLRNADLVYCVCDFAARRPYIYQHTNRLYGFIHNAAPDYSMYNKEESRQKIRTELGIRPDEIVGVTVGRVTFGKGHKTLIDAIKLLETRNYNIRYLIVGEGDYLDELQTQLADEIKSKQVILLGQRSDVKDILFASDIFILPTLHENLSIALLEACAAKLAIIATNVGGNPEVIQHGKTGIMIPPRNAEKLANAILALVRNPEKRERLAVQAQKNARTDFSQEKIFNEIETMYNLVLMQKKT
ncbi:glycosyltransferase [Paludibacter sp.]|uniref:glycosyltransferase n=1 Tax=Paludibacter sp. TaxID=1898105 RepID=UPI0013540B52|nr:glycosyltransferase [Paludibacter sp.]MTK53264.1 glycosyltransferase family 4 protein [Paludibacter sp.]